MKKPFIRLDPEITRSHVSIIADWLRDEVVCRYLSDRQRAAADLEQLLERVSLTTLTHLFSQDGCFYMIVDHSDRPLGFTRLIHAGSETELVIVIGDRDSWGRHYGRQAVSACLRVAFFEMRSERVVARIHVENERSLHVFRCLGFRVDRMAGQFVRLTLTLDDFLRLTSEQPARGHAILITRFDRERLLRWIDQPHQLHRPNQQYQHNQLRPPYQPNQPRESFSDDWSSTSQILAEEIDRAIIVDSREMPQDVITMNSRASLSIDGRELTVSLTFPNDADHSRQRISILSPIGTAILGFSAGDQFNWRLPTGLTNIEVHGLHYQPEAAGDHDL